jgi:hypothetical protein
MFALVGVTELFVKVVTTSYGSPGTYYFAFPTGSLSFEFTKTKIEHIDAITT